MPDSQTVPGRLFLLPCSHSERRERASGLGLPENQDIEGTHCKFLSSSAARCAEKRRGFTTNAGYFEPTQKSDTKYVRFIRTGLYRDWG